MRILIVLSQTLSAQEPPKKDVGNYYWIETGVGNTSFNSKGINGQLAINVAIKKNLFSLSSFSHTGPVTFFGDNGTPVIDGVNIFYGRILKKRFGFLHAKGGVGYGIHKYAVDEIHSGGWFSSTKYVYEKESVLGVSLEVGAAAKFKVIMVGVYGSAYLSNVPIAAVGLRLGLGDFM